MKNKVVEVDEMIKKMNSLHWISLRDILKILKITLGIELSHEYIRKIQLTTDKLYWRNEEIFNPNRISYPTPNHGELQSYPLWRSKM